MLITKDDVIWDKDNPPELIILCGACRTGTTALSNVFVRAGIESHMQPLKSIRRAKQEEGESDELVQWVIRNSGVIFSKETFGAIHCSEFFNPISDLLNIGYPKEKIKTILTIRDPRQTIASWKSMWGTVLMDNLEKAFLTTEEVGKFCDKLQIAHTVVVLESIRDNSVDVVVSRLFSRLGIANSTSELVNWEHSPRFGDDDPKNSNLLFYDSPPERFIEGVRNWGSYKYKDRFVPSEDEEACRLYPNLFRIYDHFRLHCEDDLSINIKPIQ